MSYQPDEDTIITKSDEPPRPGRLKNLLAATGLAVAVLGGGLFIRHENELANETTTVAPAVDTANDATMSDPTPETTADDPSNTPAIRNRPARGERGASAFPGAMTTSRSSR